MAKQSPNQRDFLLSFFKEPHDSFSLRQVNGFILNRYINGDNGKPYVSVYTLKSFAVSLGKAHPIPSNLEIKASKLESPPLKKNISEGGGHNKMQVTSSSVKNHLQDVTDRLVSIITQLEGHAGHEGDTPDPSDEPVTDREQLQP